MACNDDRAAIVGMTITACGAQTAAVLAWCCFISVLLASGGGGNLVPEPEDTIRCSDFLERDAVPQKYPQALLSAAESCEAQAASTNRYALFDCILGTLQSSPKVPEWARCLSFLSPFLLSSAHQSPNADDTETLLSAAKQLLLRKSDVALNADSLQTKVMETVKHLLRNVTCSGAVPASPAIEQTTWTYKPDRTFSKLNLKPTLVSRLNEICGSLAFATLLPRVVRVQKFRWELPLRNVSSLVLFTCPGV